MKERCNLEYKSKMETLIRAKLEEQNKIAVLKQTEVQSLALMIKGLLVPMVLISLVL